MRHAASRGPVEYVAGFARPVEAALAQQQAVISGMGRVEIRRRPQHRRMVRDQGRTELSDALPLFGAEVRARLASL